MIAAPLRRLLFLVHSLGKTLPEGSVFAFVFRRTKSVVAGEGEHHLQLVGLSRPSMPIPQFPLADPAPHRRTRFAFITGRPRRNSARNVGAVTHFWHEISKCLIWNQTGHRSKRRLRACLRNSRGQRAKSESPMIERRCLMRLKGIRIP